MLILAAAAIAASPPQRSAQGPVAVEATATVRIISGVRIRMDSATAGSDVPQSHESMVTTDGGRRTAQLIEFE